MNNKFANPHYRPAATRRDFFTRAGSGLAGIALAQMLSEDGLLAVADVFNQRPGAVGIELDPQFGRPGQYPLRR